MGSAQPQREYSARYALARLRVVEKGFAQPCLVWECLPLVFYLSPELEGHSRKSAPLLLSSQVVSSQVVPHEHVFQRDHGSWHELASEVTQMALVQMVATRNDQSA